MTAFKEIEIPAVRLIQYIPSGSILGAATVTAPFAGLTDDVSRFSKSYRIGFNSTLRFWARPSGVSFDAAGRENP